MNLSVKRQRHQTTGMRKPRWLYPEEDVKEFIKEFKRDLDTLVFTPSQVIFIKDMIDIDAGKDLI